MYQYPFHSIPVYGVRLYMGNWPEMDNVNIAEGDCNQDYVSMCVFYININ